MSKRTRFIIISWERKNIKEVFQMTWDSITQLQGYFLYLSHLPEEVIIKFSEVHHRILRGCGFLKLLQSLYKKETCV